MSDQPLCERSSRTGVRSTRIGKQRVLRLSGQEQGVDAERVLVHAADPEHPPVAAAAPDRSPHLVGEVLEGDVLVGLGQGAGDGPVGPVAAHGLEEGGDRLLVPPFHQVLEPGVGDQARAGQLGRILDVVAVQCVEEQRRPYPLVEVGARPPELLELLARRELLGQAGPGDQVAGRAVADGRVGVGDRLDQELAGGRHGRCPRVGDGRAGPGFRDGRDFRSS